MILANHLHHKTPSPMLSPPGFLSRQDKSLLREKMLRKLSIRDRFQVQAVDWQKATSATPGNYAGRVSGLNKSALAYN
jgi:hypothetical protein